MTKFLQGFLVALILSAVGIYFYLKQGYVNFNADQPPSQFEMHTAMAAVDRSTDRNAGDLKNPLSASEENIAAGAKLYINHCAGCHGVPSNPDSEFGRSFYPSVPAFFKDAPDMSESQNFYIIQHGIRWSGMPSWKNTLNENETWQLVTFMSNIEKLPPAAQQQLAPYGEPPAARPATNPAEKPSGAAKPMSDMK
jgi:thiosulfate dehydrogenase